MASYYAQERYEGGGSLSFETADSAFIVNLAYVSTFALARRFIFVLNTYKYSLED